MSQTREINPRYASRIRKPESINIEEAAAVTLLVGKKSPQFPTFGVR
jgi:hypothetical protein